MSNAVPPWTLLTVLLSFVLMFGPISVVFYEDKHKKTTRWSKAYIWLYGHAFEIILLSVSSIFAVWRLERGHSLAAAAESFLMPAAAIAGGMFWHWVHKFRSQRSQAKL